MRKGKRQDEVTHLFDQGERNKTTYQKSKQVFLFCFKGEEKCNSEFVFTL